jgi:hypothetical protein
MKKLTITIRAELDVPDHWELVEHPSGIEVLKVGDQYVDFDLTPLATRSTDPDAEWSDHDQELVGEVLDAVTGMEAEFELHSEQ